MLIIYVNSVIHLAHQVSVLLAQIVLNALNVRLQLYTSTLLLPVLQLILVEQDIMVDYIKIF